MNNSNIKKQYVLLVLISYQKLSRVFKIEEDNYLTIIDCTYRISKQDLKPLTVNRRPNANYRKT